MIKGAGVLFYSLFIFRLLMSSVSVHQLVHLFLVTPLGVEVKANDLRVDSRQDDAVT